MTLGDLLVAIRQRWWVMLGGLLLTIAAVFQVLAQPGVYWAQSDVWFLQPALPTQPNALSLTPTRAIQVASVVQREVAGVDVAHVVSDDVTIVDEGVRSGVQVRLPNAGGQWANNFNRPALNVVVVETTPDAAKARMAETLDQIDAVLRKRQDVAGVGAANRVTTQRRPQVPVVQYAGGRSRYAAATTTVIGAGMTLGVVVLLESVATRRSRRNAGAPPVGRRRRSVDEVVSSGV